MHDVRHRMVTRYRVKRSAVDAAPPGRREMLQAVVLEEHADHAVCRVAGEPLVWTADLRSLLTSMRLSDVDVERM